MSNTVHSVGIIMNGVTGRMGLNQHLRRSIYALIKQGGLRLSDTESIMPRPILVGRSALKLEAISKECGGLPWTTDLDSALADPAYSIYFDSQTTDRRVDAVSAAIAAGKHIYCEKPIADQTAVALDLYAKAQAAGVKQTRFVESAIRQAAALRARQGHRIDGAIHHSDYAEVCVKPKICGDGLLSRGVLVDFSA